MKLEVGMYVRTNIGIKQIYEIDENKTKWKYLYKLKKQDGDGCIDCGVLADEDIIKASHNLIDLIEPGDYVNGELVEDVTGEYLRVNGQSHNKHYFSKQIKSIVTHEQFDSMKYDEIGG